MKLLFIFLVTFAGARADNILKAQKSDPEESGDVAAATAAEKLDPDGKPAWHSLVDPEQDTTSKEVTKATCGSNSKPCIRFVHLAHGCFTDCQSKFDAYFCAAEKTPRPKGFEAVKEWKANIAGTHEAFESCMTHCLPQPSCAQMCGGKKLTPEEKPCETGCLDKYKEAVSHITDDAVKAYHADYQTLTNVCESVTEGPKDEPVIEAVVKDAPVVEPSMSFLGDIGASCNEACSAKGLVCDDVRLQAVDTSEEVLELAAEAGITCGSDAGATVGWAYDDSPGQCTHKECCGKGGKCQGICAFGKKKTRSCGNKGIHYQRLCPCMKQ